MTVAGDSRLDGRAPATGQDKNWYHFTYGQGERRQTAFVVTRDLTLRVVNVVVPRRRLTLAKCHPKFGKVRFWRGSNAAARRDGTALAIIAYRNRDAAGGAGRGGPPPNDKNLARIPMSVTARLVPGAVTSTEPSSAAQAAGNFVVPHHAVLTGAAFLTAASTSSADGKVSPFLATVRPSTETVNSP
jgi:hypothetical protein